MIDIVIKDFPFPPSVNTHLVPTVGKVGFNSKGRLVGKSRFFKSKEHQNYAKQVNEWYTFYNKALKKLIEEIRQEKLFLKHRFALEMSITLVTHKEKLLKYDADNRTKSVQDNLCRLLEIDDRYIFKSSIEKVLSNSGKQYAIIHLRSFQISDENSVKARHRIQ